jgi:hypothetical protein
MRSMWRHARAQPFVFLCGLVLAAGSLYGVVYWGGDVLAYRSGPQRLGVDAAVAASARQRQWVAVDAAWDCRQSRWSGPHTWVPARTSDGQLVVAHFQAPVDCEQLAETPVEGILEKMSANDLRNVQSEGIGRDHTVGWELAVVRFDPLHNALWGLGVFVVLVAVGLWLVPVMTAIGQLRTGGDDWFAAVVRKARSTHRQRTHNRWILACIALGGGGACLLMRGWVVWHVIPVPWVGFVGIAAGLFWVSLAITDR